jgi:hypothetical protein
MTINEFESEVVNRFNLYLEDANVHTAVSMIIDDCEGLSEEAIEGVLEDIIVPTVIVKFARHLNALDQIHGYEHTPSEEWSRFSKFEGINETGLAELVEKTICEDAANNDDSDDDDWDSEDWGNADDIEDEDNTDDSNVVFSMDDWKNLSQDEREEKIRNFLRKLSQVGHDNKNGLPFLKNLNVGDKANYLGVKYGDATTPFDRKRYRPPPAPEIYGANESFLPFFPHSGHGPDHQTHPLNATLHQHGYNYSHSVQYSDGNVHHLWQNKFGNQISATAHDTKWLSKTGHAFGLSVKADGVSSLSVLIIFSLLGLPLR